jgi:prepilin-type N-terminal cleavage/methylation domain-containing protein
MRHLVASQKGDTIIEVLVAIAVAASVLGITYSVMNRNLLISRANQERTEASKIAQGQLESLRDLSQTKAGRAKLAAEIPPALGATNAFCADRATGAIHRQAAVANPDASGTVTFTVNANCQEDFYNFVITKESGADPFHYRIFVQWDSVNGGQDRLSMSYRI